MTVVRKACSQNRSDNAFTCVTPLLLIKKIPCLTIIKPASKNTQASISLHQCTCADLFQSDESEDESVVWTNLSGNILRAFFV